MSKSYLIWLAAIAAFSLAFRIDVPVKPFDLIAVVLGLVILLNSTSRVSAQKLWPEAKPYLKYFFFLLLFVCIAQAISWVRLGFNPLTRALLFQYVRAAFNMYTFLLAALLFSSSKRLVVLASRAIFISPILVLPVHVLQWQQFYLGGVRLAGLLDNPIIFGFWMMVAFFIGLGLYLDAKQPRTRLWIAAWLVVIANFILWSGARSSWVAIPVGLTVLIFFYIFKQKAPKNVWRIIVLVVVSFMLGHTLLFTARSPYALKSGTIRRFVTNRAINLVTNPLATESRISIWRGAILKSFDSPFGFGFYGSVSPEQFPGAANTYLETIEAGGYGALLMFLLILTKIGSTAKKALTNRWSEHSTLNLSWFAIAVAMLTTIFFYNFFFTRILWFVLGAVLGIALSEKDRKNSTGVPFSTPTS